MKFRMLFAAAALLVCSMVAFGQGFSVSWNYYDDGSGQPPLIAPCLTGPCIPDGIMVEIHQDVNNNGNLDVEADPLASVGGGVGQVNFNTFPINGASDVGACGYFASTGNWVSNGAVPANNRFYLVVNHAGARWVSSIYSPAPGPSEVNAAWGPCRVTQVPCQPTPGPVVLAGVAPQYACVTVCPGSQTEVIVVGCGPNQPPFVNLRPGCNWGVPGCSETCQPGAGTLTPLGFGADGAWHYLLVGGEEGCVCLGWDGCPPPPCEGDGTVTLRGDRDHPSSLPTYLCADVCAGQALVIQICSADGLPLDPTKPPIVQIDPGCDNRCLTACEPGAVTMMGVIPFGAWTYSGGCWVLTVGGTDNGCICICLEGYFAAELGSFTAIARSASVEVAFATRSESNLDHFEVYRALKGHEEATLVRSFDATNTSTEHTYSFVDSDLNNGTTYVYSLRSVDLSSNRSDVLGTVEATPTFEAAVVTEYAIYQNYPNPFNPSTQITFDVLEDNNVTLTVFNATGQEVATVVNGSYAAGRHTVTFDAANLTSGLYFYSVKMGDKFTATKKMLLVK